MSVRRARVNFDARVRDPDQRLYRTVTTDGHRFFVCGWVSHAEARLDTRLLLVLKLRAQIQALRGFILTGERSDAQSHGVVGRGGRVLLLVVGVDVDVAEAVLGDLVRLLRCEDQVLPGCVGARHCRFEL